MTDMLCFVVWEGVDVVVVAWHLNSGIFMEFNVVYAMVKG